MCTRTAVACVEASTALWRGGRPLDVHEIKKERNSCEVEDFVEARLRKLCVLLPSRVLRGLCGLVQGMQSVYGEGTI